MEHRFFGSTGLRVSELCFGTQTFGWVADQKTAHAAADLFVEAGGNFFDTANIYNQGLSESILGSWLQDRGNRGSLVIASKVFFPEGEGPNQSGLSRKHIFQAVEGSLKRLHTDYLDLYQAHCFDYTTGLEESLRAFSDLVAAGKVRSIGVSNWNASQLVKALLLCRQHGWAPAASLQAEYSLLVRSTEWELLPVCREEGLAFMAWSPLAGGWLSGKYRRGEAPPENSRVSRKDRWDDQPEQRESETTWKVVEALRGAAGRNGKTPAQVALNWLLRRWEGIVPILGARTLDQLKDNLGAAGWKLAPAEIERLDAASELPLPYPYRFLQRYAKRK
jgi:aryl-alcohol dehydrogenase-like predicted oxidoreductase